MSTVEKMSLKNLSEKGSGVVMSAMKNISNVIKPKALYIATKCKDKTSNLRWGNTHVADNEQTLCGKPLTMMWWIESGYEGKHIIKCDVCRRRLSL